MLLWDVVLIFLFLPSLPWPRLLIPRSENRRKKKTSALKHKRLLSPRLAGVSQGVGRRAAGTGGRGWLCRERAPRIVCGTSWKPQKKYKHKTGRAGHVGRPQHPSPSTGSPRGPTCGFSPARKNAQGGCPLMCLGSRIKPSALPGTGIPRVLHPAGGCGYGSSSGDKRYFYSKVCVGLQPVLLE